MPHSLCLPVGPSHLQATSETVLAGREAWDRLRNDTSWADWVKVGKAIIAGRDASGLSASTSKRGRSAKKFADWRRANGFAELDKSDLRRLLVLMDNIEEVEKWRSSQPKIWTLNHPTTIYRKWKQSSACPARSTSGTRVETDRPKRFPRDIATELSQQLTARDLLDLLWALLDLAQKKNGIVRRRSGSALAPTEGHDASILAREHSIH